MTLCSFCLGYPGGRLLGKPVHLALSSCFLFYAVSIVCVNSPLGVRGRMWNSIVSVPDHCRFIYFSSSHRKPVPIAQYVGCPLRGTGGYGFDPGPRHTKVVKNGTSCSSLVTQIYDVELGLVDPVSGECECVWGMILQ